MFEKTLKADTYTVTDLETKLTELQGVKAPFRLEIYDGSKTGKRAAIDGRTKVVLSKKVARLSDDQKAGDLTNAVNNSLANGENSSKGIIAKMEVLRGKDTAGPLTLMSNIRKGPAA